MIWLLRRFLPYTSKLVGIIVPMVIFSKVNEILKKKKARQRSDKPNFCGFKFRRQKRKDSESRPHSSPDLSCGREISRGRTNPYPQSIVSPCRVHFNSSRRRFVQSV